MPNVDPVIHDSVLEALTKHGLATKAAEIEKLAQTARDTLGVDALAAAGIGILMWQTGNAAERFKINTSSLRLNGPVAAQKFIIGAVPGWDGNLVPAIPDEHGKLVAAAMGANGRLVPAKVDDKGFAFLDADGRAKPADYLAKGAAPVDPRIAEIEGGKTLSMFPKIRPSSAPGAANLLKICNSEGCTTVPPGVKVDVSKGPDGDTVTAKFNNKSGVVKKDNFFNP